MHRRAAIVDNQSILAKFGTVRDQAIRAVEAITVLGTLVLDRFLHRFAAMLRMVARPRYETGRERTRIIRLYARRGDAGNEHSRRTWDNDCGLR